MRAFASVSKVWMTQKRLTKDVSCRHLPLRQKARDFQTSIAFSDPYKEPTSPTLLLQSEKPKFLPAAPRTGLMSRVGPSVRDGVLKPALVPQTVNVARKTLTFVSRDGCWTCRMPTSWSLPGFGQKAVGPSPVRESGAIVIARLHMATEQLLAGQVRTRPTTATSRDTLGSKERW